MRLKVAYEGLEVNPGDTVVVRPNDLIRRDEAKELYDITKKAFPDNNVLVLLPNYLINTYNKEEFINLLDSLRKMVEGSTTE